MCWVGSWVCEHFNALWPLLFWQMVARITGTPERPALGQVSSQSDSWVLAHSLFFEVNLGVLEVAAWASNTTSRSKHTRQRFRYWVTAILDSNILKRDSLNSVFMGIFFTEKKINSLKSRRRLLNIRIGQSNQNLRPNKWRKSSAKCMWSVIDIPRNVPSKDKFMKIIEPLGKLTRNWWIPRIARAFRTVTPKNHIQMKSLSLFIFMLPTC